MAKALGYVLYTGPSLFDGKDIVVVATSKSRNRKTADVLQTWILLVDGAPQDNVRSGTDSSICGDCVFRAGNGCYVLVHNAPRSVHDAWTRGRYEDISGDLAAIASVGAGKVVRLGAYGDPVAVPEEIWQALVSRSSAHAGYSHAWRVAPRAFRSLVMASCETERDRVTASLRGYRTFRVSDDGRRMAGEMTCPASKEVGAKLSCSDCHACDGARGEGLSIRDVAIRLHGSRSNRARRAIASKLATETAS